MEKDPVKRNKAERPVFPSRSGIEPESPEDRAERDARDVMESVRESFSERLTQLLQEHRAGS